MKRSIRGGRTWLRMGITQPEASAPVEKPKEQPVAKSPKAEPGKE